MEKLSWLRQILEWQKDARIDEFMENLKIDLFTDEVFVFTPKGDVKSLRCRIKPHRFCLLHPQRHRQQDDWCKVNGRIVNLDYELKNGDIVEIITSSTSNGHSRDWLKISRPLKPETRSISGLKGEA